jgi:hypothetical protein
MSFSLTEAGPPVESNPSEKRVKRRQAVEKRPCLPAGKHLSRASRDYPAASPSRRRGNKSLLIRRDAVRPSHKLDGVTKSCDLFVTTSPPHPSPCQARGRLVAAYVCGERIYAFLTRDFGDPRKRDFARLNLHVGIFDQPGKSEFFNRIERTDVIISAAAVLVHLLVK